MKERGQGGSPLSLPLMINEAGAAQRPDTPPHSPRGQHTHTHETGLVAQGGEKRGKKKRQKE